MLVIIGSGLAAYNTAKAWRRLDSETPLTLVTQDEGAFYSKPQLSTGFTREKTADELVVFSAKQMAEQLNAKILTKTKVTEIVATKKTLKIDTGQTLCYEKLVLATGASVLHPPLAGDAADQVLSINSLSDYRLFREKIKDKKHIVILGSGLVGCEYSNDLTKGGFGVTIISPDHWPLQKLLPEPLGEAMKMKFEDEGIQFYLKQFVTEINHAMDGGYALTLCNQTEIVHADAVLSAVGFRPSEGLGRMAGVHCDKGILVNAEFQTSSPDIYAIGDCSLVDGIWRPFVAPIVHGSKVLAKVLAGEGAHIEYPIMPVITKTPFCPMVTVPPTGKGAWQVEGDAPDLTAYFYNDAKDLLGYSLTGKACARRQNLVKDIKADLIP